MRSIVILFTIALLISGCNNKKKERIENIQEADTYVDEYTNEYEYEDENRDYEWDADRDSLGYYGVYNGATPDPNGRTLTTTLTLYDNNRYLIHSVDVDENTKTYEEEGTYLIFGDLLTLTPDNNGAHQYYRTGDGHITRLDENKKEVTGQHALNYRLMEK